jgi:hypothetical protein
MSIRSGVFIKYVIQFFADAGSSGGGLASAVAAALPVGGAGLPLKVSNDVLAGDICIDADISVKMHRWAAGAEFRINLFDLPEPKVRLLEAAVKTPKATPKALVSLGYFDTSVQLVVDGVFEDVESHTEGDRLITTIKGRESALFACATTSYEVTLPGDASFSDALAALFTKQNAALPPNLVGASPIVTSNPPMTTLSAPTLRGSLLKSIDDLAQQANGEFFIADRQIYFGAPIVNDAVAPAQLDYATNLAKFERLTKKMLNPDKSDDPENSDELQAVGFNFVVTGDPTMRPAQKVVVNNIDGFSSPEFRIRHVEHTFSSTAGYSCSGTATAPLDKGAVARKIDHVIDPNAASALRGLDDRVRSKAAENPLIEITAVKSADDGYLASLNYGQSSALNETQPSVNTAVDQKDTQIFPKRPIVSTFAWSNCGLVTPVYPGMKAVVIHNRAKASDGLVAGYIWSKQPSMPPPKNKIGDWWLSLPIDFDSSQPPGDNTKGVNDITANNGCRVIELKGFKITVGADGLKTVGTRPTPEDSGVPEVCTIAHASGAVITLKSGEIEIDTGKGPKLTMTSSGVTMTDGTLNVQLANGKLAIG